MKTDLASKYRERFSADALEQIRSWAATAAEACHRYGDDTRDGNIAGAFHADAAKFARLDKAIRDVMEGLQ